MAEQRGKSHSAGRMNGMGKIGVRGGAGDEDGGGGDGGAVVRRRQRRLEDGGVALTVGKNPWPGQGVAAVVAAAAAVAVGLLPRPSLSSHLRGRTLLSFFK